MNILITSAGRRVSLVRSFQKELKRLDPAYKVLAIDSDPILSAACHVADSYFKVPMLDAPNYIDTLLELCLKNNIKLIVPTIDTELLELAKNKSRFLEHGISIVISSVDFVSTCRNKRLTHDLFKKKGVNVATEYAKTDYELPLFLKPIDGSRSFDTYIIKSKEDLKSFHYENDKLMFLEYLDHEVYDEFTCDMYFGKDHELKCVVPRKRLEVRDGEVYKALTVNNSLVTYLKEKFQYVEGAVGSLAAQFFLNKSNEDDIYGIEINPRFGGGYPLSYLSNANFSKWIIDEYLLGISIEPQFETWESDLLMIRYDDEILVHGYKG